MSSRRDSRLHISVRQNDALLEFENFKRKYLLVNKHITKLNSTLSVRVEELNAQVSSLYVENLRLRASEISLTSQLKTEHERARKIMEEAESAASALMEHLTGMRASLNSRSPNPGSTCAPVTRRKSPSSPVQPPRETIRLVRPPAETITQIRESDEEDLDDDDTPTRTNIARRPSTSRLPLPKLTTVSQSTTPLQSTAIPHINLTVGSTKRKPGRRNSGLLTVEHTSVGERAPSPVRGTMMRTRRTSIEREDEEREVELEVQVGIEPEMEAGLINKRDDGPRVDKGLNVPDLELAKRIMERAKKVDRKGKAKEPPREWERETDAHSTSERDSSEGSKEKEKRRFGIKDVTNSPRKGPTEFEFDDKPTEVPVAPTSALTTPSTTHTQLFDTLTPRPTPLPSPASTPATDCGSEAGEGNTARERRARKSVNYAEPKLNTKMRKPDPPLESASKSRASGGAAARRRRSIPTPSPVLPSDEDGDADVEGPGSDIRWMEGRRKTVHNSAVNMSDLPSSLGNTDDDRYRMWEGEARRHSMAI